MRSIRTAFNGYIPGRSVMRCLVVTLCVLAPSARATQLQVHIEEAIARSGLMDATVAVSVRETDNARPVVTVNADTPMMIASNMKLLTSGAALHVFGPDFQFRTAMHWDGHRLIIIGDGDPAFGDPELLQLMSTADKPGLDIDQFIMLWVNAVRDAGIKSIDDVIVDDRIFDRQFFHPSWPANQLNARYCAEVAGFNVHANVLHVFPTPTSSRRPNVGVVKPSAPWISIQNKASCETGPNDSNTAWIGRPGDSNDMTLYGNVKFAYQIPVPVTFHNPPQFFADLLADRLRRAGVKVQTARLAGANDDTSGGDIIGPVVATPIQTVLERCNRDSMNLYAEALLKRLGFALTNEPGSWENGAAVLRHIVLDRLHDPEDVAQLIVSDGSGLSKDNRVTARTLTAWLCSFQKDDRLGPAYLASLSVAGENGTLAKRFRGMSLNGATVRGKTGYIDGVSTMSGYITLPDGRCRVFSVLVNGFRKGELWRAKDLQERIVAMIAEDLVNNFVITLGSD